MYFKASSKLTFLCTIAVIIILTGCAPRETLPSAIPTTETIIQAEISPTNTQPTMLGQGSEQPAITLTSAAEIQALQNLNGHSEGVIAFVFSPDNLQLLTLSGKVVLSQWDALTGNLIGTLTEPGPTAYNAAFSKDAGLLAVGNHPSNTVGLWDAQKGELLRTLKGNREFVMKVVFSQDGTLLASGDGGGTIMVWRVESGEQVGVLQAGGTIGSLAFSPDGALLASGNVEGSTDINIWDTSDGRKIHTIRGHTGNVYNLIFTADGSQLISASGDKLIKVWNVDNGNEIRTLSGHANFIYGLALSPDGGILASSDSGGNIKVWDYNTGKLITNLRSPITYTFYLVFSPDGSFFASGGIGAQATIWGIP